MPSTLASRGPTPCPPNTNASSNVILTEFIWTVERIKLCDYSSQLDFCFGFKDNLDLPLYKMKSPFRFVAEVDMIWFIFRTEVANQLGLARRLKAHNNSNRENLILHTNYQLVKGYYLLRRVRRAIKNTGIRCREQSFPTGLREHACQEQTWRRHPSPLPRLGSIWCGPGEGREIHRGEAGWAGEPKPPAGVGAELVGGFASPFAPLAKEWPIGKEAMCNAW